MFEISSISLTVFLLLLQSLHQAAFLMSVCHIILVVQDWFTDINLIRFVVRYHRYQKQILKCINSVLVIDLYNMILFVTGSPDLPSLGFTISFS